MPLKLGRSFLVSTGRSRENEKSTPLRHFSTLKKESNDVFTFAINERFCLLSFEIPWEPTAALSEFSMYWWFIEWYKATTRYRFVSKPATLDKFISTKSRSQLVDLPKVRCEQSVFSAPRQLMSVVEGREVIVNYIKKFAQWFPSYRLNFFSTEHHGIMTQTDRAYPCLVEFGLNVIQVF